MRHPLKVINDSKSQSDRPSQEEAEKAVETLLRWVGDNPGREGLMDTPTRVVEAMKEFFWGYEQSPEDVLGRSFESSGYTDPITLTNIRIESFCEHHIHPIIGVAHIAYIPQGRVVGLSKMARLIDVFTHRLQIQEKMTADIAGTLQSIVAPKGVAVAINAEHFCMTMRGVHKPGTMTLTTHFTGAYNDDPQLKQSFLSLIKA